jgi:two-component sensor histidine kinase
MTDDAAKIRKLLRQQAAIARFGSFAFRETDLHKILMEAARVCAVGLNVPFCNVCRYRAQENDLLIEAGYGWTDVVGLVVSRADDSSPQGRAFSTGKPVICNDLRDGEFSLPAFYAAHGIVSTIGVIIEGRGQPYGVLEVDNHEQHDYEQPDIEFLTGFANVLAEAIAASERTSILRITIERMKILVDELQHRVRNNLQLVYGMLSKQLEDGTEGKEQRAFKGIARRVSTLAQVYEHLASNELTLTTDFGGYVQALCLSLADMQVTPQSTITLSCACDGLVLDLEVVTALGLVVTELVTKSYDHAFPDGKGTINVSVHRIEGDADTATMTISDDGQGFTAQMENKRHGMGLVRRLVEQVGGTATVESGGGTVWTIRFPVAELPSSTAHDYLAAA